MKQAALCRLQIPVHYLLLLLAIVVGCTTFVPDDPNLPLDNFDSGSQAEKTWADRTPARKQ